MATGPYGDPGAPAALPVAGEPNRRVACATIQRPPTAEASAQDLIQTRLGATLTHAQV